MQVTKHHPSTTETSCLVFKLQNFKKCDQNVKSEWHHINLSPRLARTKRCQRKANPWHMLKKLILHMAAMLDLWVCALSLSCSEVSSCSWLQKRQTDGLLGIWIISAAAVAWLLRDCMLTGDPQTDWSLLLRFRVEVIMLEVSRLTVNQITSLFAQMF